MKKFEITFTHYVEITYIAIVEAQNKHIARELFDEDPFEYITDDEPDEQGVDIEITYIEEKKD